MDELNKAETVARFRGTEMEVVRYLADLMLSPGRGVQALNDDLDFAFLLLRQMESDREAGTINQARKQLGTLSQSDARVAQQRYSEMARWLVALAQKAEEVANMVYLNASGAQGPIFQTQRPGSTTQDAFRSRNSSAQREAIPHAYTQENSNRLRGGAPSYIPPSNPIFISHHYPSRSRSSERADTSLHGGEVAPNAQPPPSTLGVVPPPRARHRTSSSLERLARAKIAAIEQAGDGKASQQPSAAISSGVPFVTTSRAGSRPRTSSSLERLASAKIAAIERSSNAIHCDTQAPISQNLQMTVPSHTTSNYSQPIPEGLLLSGFADASSRGRTTGRAPPAYSTTVYQDTTNTDSELSPPTCYLRWSNFNYGKPTYLPFSTVRSATVRIAHSVPGVNITGILDARDTNGDLFLRFDNPIEAEDYAEYVRSYRELLGTHSSIVPASEEEYRDAERVASARWPDRRPAMEVFGGGVIPSGPAAPTFAVTAPSPPHDTWSESSHSVGGSTLVTPSPSPSMQGSDITDRLYSPLSQKSGGEEGALRDGTDADGDNESGSAMSRPRGCRGGVRVRKRKENKRLREEQGQVQGKHDHHTRQRVREELVQAQEIQNNELRLWGLRL